MYTYALKICPTLRAFRERIDKQNKKKTLIPYKVQIDMNASAV